MIEEAYISGQLGKAIYADSGRYFVLDVDDQAKPVECRPMDVSALLNFGADLKTLPSNALDLASLRTDLTAKRRAHFALTLIISGMDEELDEETRSSAIQRAERLVEENSVLRFVRARMLARPLPSGTDIQTALKIAIRTDSTSVGILYNNILDYKGAITLLCETWSEATSDYFSSRERQLEAEYILTDLGAFSEIATAVATDNLNALNSIVVTYGQMPELDRVLGRATTTLNDLKNRLSLKLISTSSKHKKRNRKQRNEPDDTIESAGSARNILARFKNRREKQRSRTFSADEAKARVDRQIEAISRLILQGNMNLANRYLGDLIEFHVEHSERRHLGMSLCSLAKVAIDVHSFVLAEKLVDFALMLGPDDVVIANTQAQMLKAMGRFDAALETYADAIAQFPTDVVARNGYADTLRAMGRFEGARSAYADVLARYPNNQVARSGYGETLKSMGEFDRALEFCRETMARFPNEETRVGYAEALKLMGDFENALLVYEETMARFPNDEVARNGYAEVLKAMGNFDSALSVYGETIARFPKTQVARSGYAEVLKAVGNFDKALAVYEEMMVRFPYSEVARSGYAEVLKAIGSFDKALAVYEEMMARFPHSEVAHNGYAEVLKAMGDFDKALTVYETTIARLPNSQIARNGYAQVLKVIGDFDKALTVYETTIARFPNNQIARSGYAEVLKAMGDFDKALTVYEETRVRFPNDEVVRNGYASILILFNRFEEARSLLSDSRLKTKHDWIDYHLLAMSYIRSEQIDEAIRRLSYGLANAPWPEQKSYFATALAVAKIRRKEFAEVLEIVPTNVVNIDIFQKQTRLALIGHSQAALGKNVDAAQTLAHLDHTTNPRLVNLREAIARRYMLGQQPHATLSAIETRRLDSKIREQEYFLAQAA